MLYFAYGSNLLSHRLLARCASAKVVGSGVLADHSVTFEKYSFIDGSGKATIRRTTGAKAHGVLYRLHETDLTLLDQIEGVGKGYDRLGSVAIHSDGAQHTATTYIASEHRAELAPFDWYLALILAGADEHGLEETIVQLQGAPTAEDPDPARAGRQAALEALRSAGHAPEAVLHRARSGRWRE